MFLYKRGTERLYHNAIESALELANKIRDDVRETQVETWVYWPAVEEEFDVNNWGFIHANFEGEEDYNITNLSETIKFLLYSSPQKNCH